VERDLPQFGVRIPAVALRRFWSMVTHYHGQIWNAAELARALAVNESTVRRYLGLMTGNQIVERSRVGMSMQRLVVFRCGMWFAVLPTNHYVFHPRSSLIGASKTRVNVFGVKSSYSWRICSSAQAPKDRRNPSPGGNLF